MRPYAFVLQRPLGKSRSRELDREAGLESDQVVVRIAVWVWRPDKTCVSGRVDSATLSFGSCEAGVRDPLIELDPLSVSDNEVVVVILCDFDHTHLTLSSSEQVSHDPRSDSSSISSLKEFAQAAFCDCIRAEVDLVVLGSESILAGKLALLRNNSWWVLAHATPRLAYTLVGGTGNHWCSRCLRLLYGSWLV